MFTFSRKAEMPAADDALPGRAAPIPTALEHFVNGHSLKGPYPDGLEMAMFGLGCFWGAERKFLELGDGVYVTAVGYTGGYTPNPTYEEVCSGRTGHNEVVLVVYDPKEISYEHLLKTFWEDHNPTLGMRQGNDVGTQYRSGIYVYFAGATRRCRGLARQLRQSARRRRYGSHHDGNPRGAAVLFRRGLSPAIFGEESPRLLRPRRHGGELPDRHWRSERERRGALTGRAD